MTLTDTVHLDSVTVVLCGLCLCGTIRSGHDLWGRLTLSAAVSEDRGKVEAQFEVANELRLQLLLYSKHLNSISVVYIFIRVSLFYTCVQWCMFH